MTSVARSAHDQLTLSGRIAWSRGEGCLPLATHLSDAPPIQINGDLRHSCVTQQIDMLVSRRLGSFDLVPVIAPHHVDFDAVEAVTTAVGDGPNSLLAAAVGSRLGAALDVPAELTTVYRTPAEIPSALARLERLAQPHPHLGQRAVNAPTATRLIDSLTPGTLLVVGAPGGSWLQRQLYGTGRRLLVTAPCGAVVVRAAPRRCYQEAADATGIALGRHLTVGDALRLMRYPVVPVADGGVLVGVVRVGTLETADPMLPIDAVMEPPVAIADTEATAAVSDLLEFFGQSPVPVVDAEGHLVGTVAGLEPDSQ